VNLYSTVCCKRITVWRNGTVVPIPLSANHVKIISQLYSWFPALSGHAKQLTLFIPATLLPTLMVANE